MSPPANILILGGAGMLGHKLCQRLPDEFRVAATVRQNYDLAATYPDIYGRVQLINNVDVLRGVDLERILDAVAPQAIVNCIGVVKQKAAAEDRFLSVAINSLLPHRLARWCEAHGSRLIHISTDCVFDGTRGRYRESEPSDATDVYGKSKFLGETEDRETAAVTLRTSIVGRELFEPFHGLFEWFLAQRGGRCRGFAKAVFSGFTTNELSRIISLTLKNPDLKGLYHVASHPIDKDNLLRLLNEAYKAGVSIERDETFCCDRSLIMDRFTVETGYAPPAWPVMIQALRNDPTPYDAWTTARRELERQWREHELPC
jgi:dTDP-4-dehydrorhamnose reductase